MAARQWQWSRTACGAACRRARSFGANRAGGAAASELMTYLGLA
jgi:hypothetical protein